MRSAVLSLPVLLLIALLAAAPARADRAEIAPPLEARAAAEQPAGTNAGQGAGQTNIPKPEQTMAPPKDLPMDTQMIRAKAAYEEATKNLTPEQLEQLKALEAEFSASMESDMRILHRSAEMEHCLTHDGFFKADKNRHVKAFVEWRKKLQDEQAKVWAVHKQKRFRLDFVSVLVLNDYYVYQTKMLKLVGLALARQQMASGVFKDTDCEALAKKLAAGE